MGSSFLRMCDGFSWGGHGRRTTQPKNGGILRDFAGWPGFLGGVTGSGLIRSRRPENYADFLKIALALERYLRHSLDIGGDEPSEQEDNPMTRYRIVFIEPGHFQVWRVRRLMGWTWPRLIARPRTLAGCQDVIAGRP